MTQSVFAQQALKSFKRNIIDEQAAAQAELEHHISQQAQAVAPEEFTSVEIDFYNHEIYANGQLIAQISYDHSDFVTQRWLVMVNDKEEFRADTWGRCYRYICTHHKDSSLPVQEPETPAATTGNEIMAQIFDECEKYGYCLDDDGIYSNGEKLGEVGLTDGKWWFLRADDSKLEKTFCESASDAVWWLSVDSFLVSADALDEYLQYRPLEQMPSGELTELLDSADLVAV